MIVEFDLYYNNILCDDTNDPSDNHIGIMYNGNRNHSNPALIRDIAKAQLDMKDGKVHRVTIRYTAATTTLNIKIDTIIDWSATVNLTQAGVDADGKMWIGFTGGTFLARQNHNVLSWRFARLQGPVPTASTTPTQAPAQNPASTVHPTITPTVHPMCNIDRSLSFSVFRAPIEGNPIQDTITTRPALIDAYAVDPLTKHLWFHIQRPTSPNPVLTDNSWIS